MTSKDLINKLIKRHGGIKEIAEITRFHVNRIAFLSNGMKVGDTTLTIKPDEFTELERLGLISNKTTEKTTLSDLESARDRHKPKYQL